MDFIKAYYYFFYKLYNFWEDVSTPKFWSDWKAVISIDVLISLLLYSFSNYYNVLVDSYYDLPDKRNVIIIFIAIIFLPNYYIFISKDKWKEKIIQFKDESKRQKLIGGIIVWGIILLVFTNLAYSLWIMNQIDWKKYR